MRVNRFIVEIEIIIIVLFSSVIHYQQKQTKELNEKIDAEIKTVKEENKRHLDTCLDILANGSWE